MGKRGCGMLAALLLGGCSVQGDFALPEIKIPSVWSRGDAAVEGAPIDAQALWWKPLHDPAVNQLVAEAHKTSPTLALAVARMEEARANAGAAEASYFPVLGVSATASDAKNASAGAGAGGASSGSGGIVKSANIGPTLSWQPDLFGRVRGQSEAAQASMEARTADAAFTRLSLEADVVNGVLALRSCEALRAARAADVASYEITYRGVEKKVKAGFASAIDRASSVRDLAAAKVTLRAQEERCEQTINNLVALTGARAQKVKSLLAKPLPHAAAVLPDVPQGVVALPAEILAHHPTIAVATHEAAAAWGALGTATANRLPVLDLSSAYSEQWIRAGGSTLSSSGWSLLASLTGTVFDAGRLAAEEEAAAARYRQSLAAVESAVRTAVRDVEDALAAQASAKDQRKAAQESEEAAFTVAQAKNVAWQQGLATLLEMEDAKRQHSLATTNNIAAQLQEAQAWVALVLATGNQLHRITDSTPLVPSDPSPKALPADVSADALALPFKDISYAADADPTSRS